MSDPIRAARELLAFYVEAGVDTCLGDAPFDRLAQPNPAPAEATVPSRTASALSVRELPRGSGAADLGRADGGKPHHTPTPRQSPLPIPPEEAQMAAREAARRAESLEELRAILERFDGCTLKNTAKKLVFSDGNPSARVMFVGEAPGRDEDLEGRPFVGRSGKLLDRMLAAIGLDRGTNAYIANIIPWRPPGNRTPTPQEAAICLPFISRQIELSEAEILVCLGGPSAQALLGVKDGILKTRGRWFSYTAGSRSMRAIATLHPAYLLRSPLQKRLAWRDFLLIKKALES
jgi:DNA polymerase